MEHPRPRGAVYALRLAALGYLSAASSLLFWSHAPQAVGWQPRVVLSGSMAPVMRPGDVALIGPATPGPSTLPPGSVALVRDPERESGFYLHRVVRYEADGRLVTRGDANRSDDWPAVDPARVAGQLRLVVPAAGLPQLWWHQRAWPWLALSGGGTWTAIVLVLGLRSHGRR
jgi:signal peptidase